MGGAAFHPTPAWPIPERSPRLGRTDVHLWRCWLDQSPDRLDALSAVLSSEERARAERPFHQRGRRYAVVARGFLRRVLAGYLGTAAEKLALVYGEHGKPALDEVARLADVRFNLSHSGDIAILAVARGRDLGADVERLRPVPEHARIAARFFSRVENAALGSQWATDPVRGFFTCWTRKEAYIKAIGHGLSHPLDGFDVSIAPDEPARLLRVERDPTEVTRWTFDTFEPAPGYLGAVAVEGTGWRLIRWSFEP
jgi:4'-phosphopantetheinyl transferase